ncbi:hypothetical protein YC2023_086371 [Brassica napus]
MQTKCSQSVHLNAYTKFKDKGMMRTSNPRATGGSLPILVPTSRKAWVKVMSIVVDVNRVSDVTQDENVYERLKKVAQDGDIERLTTSQPYSDGERVIALDSSLVSIKGRGRITPLHHVARIGDAELLSELLFACPSSVEDLTIKCETALHIAVKNHQFEAFKVLLGWVQRVNREDILDWKDEDGNTIFHIAALTNQTEVTCLSPFIENTHGWPVMGQTG